MARVQEASLLAVTVAAALLFAAASGATYTVGEPGGSWDLHTNYTAWASSIVFHPGDVLVFKNSPAAHATVEVSRAGYRSCSPEKPVSGPRAGDLTVQLTDTGRRYFICGVPGHCAAGMKLEVRVVPPRPLACDAPPAPPAAKADNGPPGRDGPGTPGGVCIGDDGGSPTIITTPSSISYGSAPGSSSGSVSSVLAPMVLLLSLML
ncbi:hypothetical protein ACP4OV_018652 [Aristida adscensionis]